MLARDIATRRVIQAEVTQSLREAACSMYRHQVSCLVVTSSQGQAKIPVGMLSIRDVATAVLLEGKDPDTVAIAGIMSRPPVVAREDCTLAELIAILRGSGVRRLPVVDAAGGLVGIVSADDMIAAMAELMEDLARALIVDPQLDHAVR
jgi:CBS domain-containing protein